MQTQRSSLDTRRRRHRRRHGRPLALPLVLTLCAAGQLPPGAHQDGRSGAFVVQLARRLTSVHPDVLEALALERSEYRTDRLLELGADLSEALVAYGQGLVGESSVRVAALDVATEAAAVWAATCGLSLTPEVRP